MAIIIPSKNIYEKNNQKIKDNIFKKISIPQNDISVLTETDVIVFDKKYRPYIDYQPQAISILNQDFDENSTNISGGGYSSVMFAGAYVGYNSHSIANMDIFIPLVSRNRYAESLILGVDSDGNPNIKISLIGHTETGTAESDDATINSDYPNIIYGIPTVSKSSTIDIPKSLEKSSDIDFSVKAKATEDIADLSNLSSIISADIINKDGEDYYKIKVQFITNVRTVELSAFESYPTTNPPSRIIYRGTYTDYITEQVQITINGNVKDLSYTEKTITIGKGDKPFSLGGNELIQDTAKLYNVSLAEKLAQTVLGEYENGKETATILCGINDYYNENGEKVIQTKNPTKMTFELFDEVIPFVCNPRGDDEPMSTDENGNAKRFSVVGIDFFYDGAVWQKLHLLEK